MDGWCVFVDWIDVDLLYGVVFVCVDVIDDVIGVVIIVCLFCLLLLFVKCVLVCWFVGGVVIVVSFVLVVIV